MICPNCKYDHETWDSEYNKHSKGALGGFYCLPVEATRGDRYGETDRRTVFVCPNCGVMFMEVRK